MGRAPCCDKASVKRGPWSPEEDELLRTYVRNHGAVSNWIALPHKAGTCLLDARTDRLPSLYFGENWPVPTELASLPVAGRLARDRLPRPCNWGKPASELASFKLGSSLMFSCQPTNRPDVPAQG
jgi:hypothetical protein